MQVLLLHTLETVPTIATCRMPAATRTAPLAPRARGALPLVRVEDNWCVSVAYICDEDRFRFILFVVRGFFFAGVAVVVVVAAVALIWVLRCVVIFLAAVAAVCGLLLKYGVAVAAVVVVVGAALLLLF